MQLPREAEISRKASLLTHQHHPHGNSRHYESSFPQLVYRDHAHLFYDRIRPEHLYLSTTYHFVLGFPLPRAPRDREGLTAKHVLRSAGKSSVCQSEVLPRLVNVNLLFPLVRRSSQRRFQNHACLLLGYDVIEVLDHAGLATPASMAYLRMVQGVAISCRSLPQPGSLRGEE